MKIQLAPAWAFAATARRTPGLPWAAADALHVRVQHHPALGLPVAPFLFYRAVSEPLSMGEPTAIVPPPDVAAELRGAQLVPLPQLCCAVAVEAGVVPGGGPFVLEVLDPTRIGGGDWSRPVVASVRSDGGSAMITGSGIRLVRLRPVDDGASLTGVSIRGWLERQFASWPDPSVWARLGLPAKEASPWYRPEVGSPSVVEARGLVPTDLIVQAGGRVAAGAPAARGPGDVDPGPIDAADQADAERARVQVLRTGLGVDLDGLVRTMLEQPAHPLLDPPMVDRLMERGDGGTPRDRYAMRARDALALATLDPGVGRWFGSLLTADDPDGWLVDSAGPWSPQADDPRLGFPVTVVGAWWVPEHPLLASADRRGLRAGEALAFQALLDPAVGLDPSHPYAAPFVGAGLDAPPPGHRLVLLAAATSIPVIPSVVVPPAPTLQAGTSVEDHAWMQRSPEAWRQVLRLPSSGQGSLAAGCRLVVRRSGSGLASDEPATPTISAELAVAAGADPAVVAGRAIPWLPTTKGGAAPTFHERGRTEASVSWIGWAVDEFGAWSEPGPSVSATRPDRLEPAPPSLAVHVEPALADAEAREGRGWLRCRVTLGPELAGSWPVDRVEVLVDGVAAATVPRTGARDASFDAGWLDLSDHLPVLARGAAGQVVVGAVAVAVDDAGGEHRRAAADQVRPIVDGRAPIPEVVELRVHWTSRATPGGTAALTVRADEVRGEAVHGFELHLADEPSLRSLAREAGQAYPASTERPQVRADRIAELWGHGEELPPTLFHVVGRAGPGGVVEVPVPGRLRDLVVVRAVPLAASGRPADPAACGIRLYAVPPAVPPATPDVQLHPGAGGQLAVTVAARPAPMPVVRWQLLVSSHPDVTDVRSFAVTDRVVEVAALAPSDPPPTETFTISCPPWVPVRVSARLALASDLGAVTDPVPCGSWSAPAVAQSYTYLPDDPPDAPVVEVTPVPPADPADPAPTTASVAVTVRTPGPVSPRAMAGHTATVLLDVGGNLTVPPGGQGLALLPPLRAPGTPDAPAEAEIEVGIPVPGGAAACALHVHLVDPIGRPGATVTVPLP